MTLLALPISILINRSRGGHLSNDGFNILMVLSGLLLVGLFFIILRTPNENKVAKRKPLLAYIFIAIGIFAVIAGIFNLMKP